MYDQTITNTRSLTKQLANNVIIELSKLGVKAGLHVTSNKHCNYFVCKKDLYNGVYDREIDFKSR